MLPLLQVNNFEKVLFVYTCFIKEFEQVLMSDVYKNL